MVKVKGLVATSVLMEQQKEITERIKKHYKKSRNYTNKVERYVKLAGINLITNISRLVFTDLRVAIKAHNDEGIVKKFRDLLQHIELNKDPLEKAGLTSVFLKEMETFIDTFETDSKGQTRKLDERLDTTDDNDDEYDKLWDLIANIMLTGKTIYKDKEAKKDKDKIQDYTYDVLIKKVHLAQEKKNGGNNNPGGTAV